MAINLTKKVSTTKTPMKKKIDIRKNIPTITKEYLKK